MKILIISPSNTFPALSGGAVRTNALLKYLAKENEIFYVYNKYHQVKEVRKGKIKFNIKNKTRFSNVKLYPVGPSIRTAQLFNPFLLKDSYKIIKKQKIDLIIGEFAWSGVYLILLKIFTNVPYIIDEHNIEYRLVKFNYGFVGRLISPLVKIYEKRVWKFSEHILCVSGSDRKAITNAGVNNEKIFVVPHAIEGPHLKKIDKKGIKRKLNLNRDDSIVLFFGKLDYFPNKEAVDIIYKEILPRILIIKKNIKFLIVGSNPPKINHKNIIFTGPVKDIRNFLFISDIVINPSLHGVGKRSKIIESIANGKKVVSTTIGAGELIDENLNEFLIICDDWDRFTQEIIKHISKKDKKPPKEFLEKYSWEKNIGKLKGVIK